MPYNKEQAREIALLTETTKRQIALLIDRKGRVLKVIVGDSEKVVIPYLGRERLGSGRLRGLRLLHTHRGATPITEEDLMDLIFLRLDCLSVLNVKNGEPFLFQWAYILPPNPRQKLYFLSDPVPWDKVTINISSTIEALEEELAKTTSPSKISRCKERALLVSVGTAPRTIQEKSLTELTDLAKTAGVEVVGTLIQRINKKNPQYILGKGKIAELEVMCLQRGANLIIFDGELSPSQINNLAEITERKILDRTQLILDIFAQHAKSRAGKYQVELAQLEYTLPRLVGKNRAMSRLTGGIGGRGPGETKLEIDRRKIKERRVRVKKEILKIKRHREHTRIRRKKAGIPIVALVGYTNVGKSTLLNSLTYSRIYTANKLFATLDPTSRRIKFPNEKEVIITDTVGFIKHLPQKLKDTFMATLEELYSADLIVHVADASHQEVDGQIEAVEEILQDMNLIHLPSILVLNKWDKTPKDIQYMLLDKYPQALPISALKKEGLDRLVEYISQKLPPRELQWTRQKEILLT